MHNKNRLRLAVDIGGTFTDTVLVDGRGQILATNKAPTTPDGADPQPCLSAGHSRRIYQATGSKAQERSAPLCGARPAFKPGSRFVRAYQRVSHVVKMGDCGRFVCKDQSFKSLSHTAREIISYNVWGFQCFVLRL